MLKGIASLLFYYSYEKVYPLKADMTRKQNCLPVVIVLGQLNVNLG
jgi:hypothetical protein